MCSTREIARLEWGMGLEEELRRRVAGIHVFAGLAGETITFLAGRAAIKELARGEWVCREGELSAEFFCLVSGRVEIVRGEAMKLAELGEGECFGEMSMLECQPRSAGVRCLEASVVIQLRSTDLLSIYRENPSEYAIIILNLARDLARRLHRLGDVFAALSHRAADEEKTRKV